MPVADAPLEVHQLRQGRPEVRLDLECALVGTRGLLVFAVLVERQGELIQVAWVVRRIACGFAVRRFGLHRAAGFGEDVAEHEVRVGPLRRELDRAARAGFGALQLAQREQRAGLIQPGACVVGTLRDRAREAIGCAVIVAARIEQAAEIVQSGCMAGFERERAPQCTLGVIPLRASGVQAGEIAQHFERMRRQLSAVVSAFCAVAGRPWRDASSRQPCLLRVALEQRARVPSRAGLPVRRSVRPVP